MMMMWKANKAGILALLAGGCVLGAAYWYLKPEDEELARQVLATGVCVLLLVVATVSWISARRGM